MRCYFIFAVDSGGERFPIKLLAVDPRWKLIFICMHLRDLSARRAQNANKEGMNYSRQTQQRKGFVSFVLSCV